MSVTNSSADFLGSTFLSWMVPMIWQVALLVGILFLVSYLLTPFTSARFRYALWLIVPLRLIIPPTFALATSWGWWFLPPQTNSIPNQSNISIVDHRFTPQDNKPPLIPLETTDAVHSFPNTGSLAQKLPSASDNSLHIDSNPTELSNSSITSSTLNSENSSMDTDFLTDSNNFVPSNLESDSLSFSWVPSWEVILVFGWLVGVLIFLTRIMIGLIQSRRLVKESYASAQSILDVGVESHQLVSLKNTVPILCSEKVTTPTLVGILRPAVLLPPEIQKHLNKDELRTVLVHELSHVKRWDPITNFFTCLLTAVYWFHPCVWIAQWKLRTLRELACDESTVASLSGARKSYAKGLVKVAELISKKHPITAIGFLERKSDMKNRVLKILDARLRVGKRLSLTALLMLALLGLFLLPGAGRPAENTGNNEATENTTSNEKLTTETNPVRSSQNTHVDSSLGYQPPKVDFTLSGKVLDDSQPAKDLIVELYSKEVSANPKKHSAKKICKGISNSSGVYNLEVKKENLSQASTYWLVFRKPNGKYPVAVLGVPFYRPVKEGQVIQVREIVQISDHRPTTVTFVGHNNKSIVGAKISVLEICTATPDQIEKELDSGLPSFRQIVPREMMESVVTQQDGGVLLNSMPTGGYLFVRVEIPGKGNLYVMLCEKTRKVTLDLSSSFNGKMEADSGGFQFEKATATVYLEERYNKEKNYRLNFSAPVEIQSDGTFSAKNLPPGNYRLKVDENNEKFYASNIKKFQLQSGKNITAPSIKFRKMVPLELRFVDEEEKGIPGVKGFIFASRKASIRFKTFHSSEFETDQNGYVKTFVPHGAIRFMISDTKNYAPVTQQQYQKISGVVISESTKKVQLEKITLRKTVSLRGVVVGPDGKPAQGAYVCGYWEGSMPNCFFCDEKGQFVIPKVDPDKLIKLYARNEKAVCPRAIVIDPQQQADKKISITISPDNGFFLKGKLTDRNSNPIVDAEVNVIRNAFIPVRNRSDSGVGWSSGGYRSDKNGQFLIGPLHPDDRYQLNINSRPFQSIALKEVKGNIGETVNFGSKKLRRTDITVSGKVVDTQGNPVSGATLFNVANPSPRFQSKTTAAGDFQLKGILEGPCYLFAKSKGRIYSHFIEEYDQPIRFQLNDPASFQPKLKPYSLAERKELARYIINRLLDLPASSWQRNIGSLLVALSKVDPKKAIKLTNQDEYKKYQSLVFVTIAKEIIDTDPEEAMALLRQVPSSHYVSTIQAIAESVLQKNPKIARKIAESLVRRVGVIDPPELAIYQANLSALLTDLNEEEAAAAMAERAFKLAEELPKTVDNSHIKGSVGAALARRDLNRSLNLIHQIKEQQTTVIIVKDRFLSKVAKLFAKSDPKKAIKIASDLESMHAPKIAYQLALNDVKFAEEYLTSISESVEGHHLVSAWIAVAQACGEKNSDTANRYFKQAVATCMNEPEKFNVMSNYGGGSPVAGWAAALAAKQKSNAISSLMPMALASRRNLNKTQRYLNLTPLRGQLRMAKYLALVDRQEALNVLKIIDQYPELLGHGGYNSLSKGTYLMVLCLSDKVRAKIEFENFLDEIVESENPTDVYPLLHLARVLSSSGDEFYRQISNPDALRFLGEE